MTFITGTALIDAPASALNNSGEPIPQARTDNTSAVKFIRANNGKTYPYVSAQAVRYWLRHTLETDADLEWPAAPIYRENKVAYTDANPIQYWDDDLFGYMRAPSKKAEKEAEAANLTPMEKDKKGNPVTVTRAAPFRVSTFVSVAPVKITTDFGTMSRHDGDPVPYEHQFYRAVLQGLFSIDLSTVGTFTYLRRTGFQNLDAVRKKIAEDNGLEPLEDAHAYRFDREERIKRLNSLLRGFSRMQGGAKQSTHYTDVSPAVVILAAKDGGDHPFNYLFSEKDHTVQFEPDVFIEALNDAKDSLLSPVFIGWKPGFLSESREAALGINVPGVTIELSTPRVAFEQMAAWLEANGQQWDR